MGSRLSIVHTVGSELKDLFMPPRQLLNVLIMNGAISFFFFFISYRRGTFNSQLLPIAAATILLWTLADVSLTNHLLFDKQKTVTILKARGNLKQLLLAKNLALAIISIPFTIIFGLILVAITGKWSEITYGTIIAMTLIWGWLGISNAMSTEFPFEMLKLKKFLHSRHVWIRYSFLYGLPWILLPIYAFIISLPLILIGWTKNNTAQDHKIIALLLLLTMSIAIWHIGYRIADRAIKRSNSRIHKLIIRKYDQPEEHVASL